MNSFSAILKFGNKDSRIALYNKTKETETAK